MSPRRPRRRDLRPIPIALLVAVAEAYLNGLPAPGSSLTRQLVWIVGYPAALGAALATWFVLRRRSAALQIAGASLVFIVVVSLATSAAHLPASPEDRTVHVELISSGGRVRNPENADSAADRPPVPGAAKTVPVPSQPAAAPTYRGINIGGDGSSCLALIFLPERFVASLLTGITVPRFAYDNFVPDANVFRAGEPMVLSRCPPVVNVTDWQFAARNKADVTVNAIVDSITSGVDFAGKCSYVAEPACAGLGGFVRSYAGELRSRGVCDVRTYRRWQWAQHDAQGRVVVLGRVMFVCATEVGGIAYCQNDPVSLEFDSERVERVLEAQVLPGRASADECAETILSGGSDPN